MATYLTATLYSSVPLDAPNAVFCEKRKEKKINIGLEDAHIVNILKQPLCTLLFHYTHTHTHTHTQTHTHTHTHTWS
jgi:hypothetical protein